jgi:uncharacterized protein (TIGR00297 family)
MCGHLGHYACCNSDTWASELGILAEQKPRHIITFKKVPAGTNGGVTLLGLSASFFGGAFIGIAHWLMLSLLYNRITTIAYFGWTSSSFIIPFCAMCGLLGSILDSILGGTLQYSGILNGKVVNGPGPNVERICGINLLSNNGVNLISASITVVIAGLVSPQFETWQQIDRNGAI